MSMESKRTVVLRGADEKRTVVLLFGGRSSEHGISCVTAAGVLGAIDRALFDVIPIGITRQGATVPVDEAEVMSFSLDGDALPEVVDSGAHVLWPASTDSAELRVIDEHGALESLGEIDVVMPLLHGPFGEDGTVQGMFELVGIPYVGSGVLGSSLCMDKHAAKTLLAATGVQVAPWHTVTRGEFVRDPDIAHSLDAGLEYPLFVKPSRAGSSVGVTKVTAPAELVPALEVAFAEDSIVLVEQSVVGREIEIAVLGGRAGSPPRASGVVGEIVFSGREFYDFEAKYLGAAGVDLVLPAPVADEELRSLQQVAVRAFEQAQCAGLARVDFFLTEHGPVLNEINTMPGFTPISMYPRLWEESGVAYTDLITELIELALER